MPMMVAGTGCSRAVCTTLVASALEPSLNTPMRLDHQLLRGELARDGIHRAVHGRPGAVDVRLDLVRAVAAAVGARHWIFALSHCLFSWRLWVVCRGARLVFFRSSIAFLMRP